MTDARFATKAELDRWMAYKHWFFVKRVPRTDSGEAEIFTDTYLTPNGQEVSVYFENGKVKDVSTIIFSLVAQE